VSERTSTAGTHETPLADGCYDCQATVHVSAGKADVVLHTTFGLAPGTAIPLLRRDGDLLVEERRGSLVKFFNGHTII
jgi:hypothetical protein